MNPYGKRMTLSDAMEEAAEKNPILKESVERGKREAAERAARRKEKIAAERAEEDRQVSEEQEGIQMRIMSKSSTHELGGSRRTRRRRNRKPSRRQTVARKRVKRSRAKRSTKRRRTRGRK